MANTGAKNICLIAIHTGGAGMENWFISTFFFIGINCDIVESWNGTSNEPNNDNSRKKNKKNNRMNEVSFIFFALLHLNHSVLLLVTDIKCREKNRRRNRKYIKQFRIDKLLSSKFWFWLLWRIEMTATTTMNAFERTTKSNGDRSCESTEI